MSCSLVLLLSFFFFSLKTYSNNSIILTVIDSHSVINKNSMLNRHLKVNLEKKNQKLLGEYISFSPLLSSQNNSNNKTQNNKIKANKQQQQTETQYYESYSTLCLSLRSDFPYCTIVFCRSLFQRFHQKLSRFRVSRIFI